MSAKILRVIETGIYVDDLDAAEDFYGRVLGLRVLLREDGRHVFFQVGENSMLLAFLPEATKVSHELPSHGMTGAGHFALGIERDSVDEWRERLIAAGVTIEQEVDWPHGGHSIYFRDPAGNSAELITPGVWGLPSGW